MDGKYRSDLQQRERYQSYHDGLMYGVSFDCAHATNSSQRHIFGLLDSSTDDRAVHP